MKSEQISARRSLGAHQLAPRVLVGLPRSPNRRWLSGQQGNSSRVMRAVVTCTSWGFDSNSSSVFNMNHITDQLLMEENTKSPTSLGRKPRSPQISPSSSCGTELSLLPWQWAQRGTCLGTPDAVRLFCLVSSAGAGSEWFKRKTIKFSKHLRLLTIEQFGLEVTLRDHLVLSSSWIKSGVFHESWRQYNAAFLTNSF